MSEYAWLSIISLLAWLILAVSSWRARKIGAKKTVVLALAWGSIFMLVAAFFTAIGR